jgi:hypothetical protein
MVELKYRKNWKILPQMMWTEGHKSFTAQYDFRRRNKYKIAVGLPFNPVTISSM